MLRLTWFLPESRLCTALERLVRTDTFHLFDQVRLGDVTDISELKTAYYNRHHARLQQQGRALLDKFPSHTLLSYRIGQLPPGMTVEHQEETLITSDDGLFLWSGESDPPATLTPYFFPEEPIKAPDLAVEISERQWQMLLATAECIGHVGPWAIIDGWIPAHEQEHFSRLLENEVVCFCTAEQSGLPFIEIPVQHERPEWLEGFSALMQNFGLTGYRELDPTYLLATGFILMFGMMFADLGQGLLLTGLGFLLLHTANGSGRLLWLRGSTARIVGKVLVPIGLSAALFGALFGSCFAREDIVPALWFHPMENVFFYLGASIGIGMLTITLGLALSLFNTFRMRADKPWFWEKYGLLGLVYYIGFVLLALAVLLRNETVAAIGGLLCLLMLALLMCHTYWEMHAESHTMRFLFGVLECYDIIMKFLVQTLSFARIAAFTLAHVGLSKAVVLITDLSAGWPLLAAGVMVFGNLFIILLEGLLVSIQVVRLHFFEFFTKFVVGGGRPFRPLSMEETERC